MSVAGHIIRFFCYGLVFTVWHSMILGQTCDATLTDKPQESLAILKNEQAQREHPDCITFALHGIRGTETKDAVTMLLKYLDFKRPLTKAEKAGIHRLFVPGEIFPAIDGLYLLGDLAVPGLVSTIGSPDSAELVRDNALIAFMEIHRTTGPKGINLLKQEALKRTDSQEQLLLMNAATKAVEFCSEADREECVHQLQ